MLPGLDDYLSARVVALVTDAADLQALRATCRAGRRLVNASVSHIKVAS